MAWCGQPFRALAPLVDENRIQRSHDESWGGKKDQAYFRSLVQALALAKAQAVLKDHPEAVTIGSDSIVVLEGEILGKPKDSQEARAMLSKLSGKSHRVYTGVCIADVSQVKTFSDHTRVTFFPEDRDLIEAYVLSGSPMDKAGAYGIQDMGALFVAGIEGDYYTVMGLPVARVYRELKSWNLE